LPLIRQVAIGATVVLCSLWVGGVAGAVGLGRAAGLSCPQRRGQVHVLTADRQAVVYEAVNYESSEQLYEVLACAHGARRRYVLGARGGASSDGGAGLDRFRLAGPVVAYEEYAFNAPEAPVETATNVIFVRNLRTGRVLHRLPTGPSTPPNEIGDGPVLGLVVKSDGAVAWITGGTVEGVKMSVIHAVDRSGNRVVASGTGIDRDSLRLRGSTLSWTQNGTLASTSLM
jgi:hypothetical protein